MAVAYFDTEKLNLLSRVAIQSFHGRAVLLGKALGNPDDRHRLQTCSIGEELPQMAMVRPLQLVLNEHPLSVDRVLPEQVSAKLPHVFSVASTVNSRPMASPSSCTFSSLASQGLNSVASCAQPFRRSTLSRWLNLGISMSESNRWRK